MKFIKGYKGKRIKDLLIPATVLIVGAGVMLVPFRSKHESRVHYNLPKGCSGIFVVRVDSDADAVTKREAEADDANDKATGHTRIETKDRIITFTIDVPRSGVVKIASPDYFGVWAKTTASVAGGEAIPTDFSEAEAGELVLMDLTGFSSDGEMRVLLGTQNDYEAITRSGHLHVAWEPSLFVCK